MNVVLVASAETVMLAGTVATAVLLVDRDTAVPPLGAGAIKVTVPVADEPPTTVAGFTASELSSVVDCGGGTEVLLPDPPHEFNVINTATSPRLDRNSGPNRVFRKNFIDIAPSPSQIR